jgi:hypothetical protein
LEFSVAQSEGRWHSLSHLVQHRWSTVTLMIRSLGDTMEAEKSGL